MADSVSLRVNQQSLAELEQLLREHLPREARLALRIGVMAGAGVIKKEAVRRARAQFKRKTGNLVKGIKVRVFYRRRGGATEVVGRVAATAPHSHLLEDGWAHTGNVPKSRARRVTKIPGRPFVGPAAEATKEEAIARMEQKTAERLERMGRR